MWDGSLRCRVLSITLLLGNQNLWQEGHRNPDFKQALQVTLMQGDWGSWTLTLRGSTLSYGLRSLASQGFRSHIWLEMVDISGCPLNPDWESSHGRATPATHAHSWVLLSFDGPLFLISVMALVKAQKELTEATEERAQALKCHFTRVARVWPSPPVDAQSQSQIRMGWDSKLLFLFTRLSCVTTCSVSTCLPAPSGTSSFAPSGFMDPWYSCYVLGSPVRIALCSEA